MFKGQEVTIVHIVEDMSPVSGGVATVVRMLSNELSSEKIKHVVVCNKADKTVVGQSVTLKIFKPGKYDLGWGYSRQACDYLVDISSSRNVVFHIHGIWKSLHFFAAKISRERDVPCVLTAHAMLDNWFWYGQGWLKRLKKNLYWTFLSYNFKKLHCLHAITPSETLNLKTLLPNAEVVTIPNTMYVPTINRFKQYSGDQGKYFLFIGRIDAQKGLDVLVKAYLSSKIKTSIKLLIVGPIGDRKYWDLILKYIKENDFSDSVEYLGPKFGREKDDLICNALSCVIPSRTEVIGMVNLEAASLCCPSITTFETGLHDWEDGGGILISAENESSCRNALDRAADWSFEERVSRGAASYNLVFNKYNISKIKLNWIDLYSKLTSK
tara:strand:+ start:569 stop:1714 length:1146 start_codon:yes stop_codon:yes gene_type:complete